MKKDLDMSLGVEIESMNCILVVNEGQMMRYCSKTFVLQKTYEIPLLESTTREINEVIAIQVSGDETCVAIISGKNLLASEQFANQLFIYQLEEGENDALDFV